MSRVNIDAQAWLDSRFAVLADEMGWEDPDLGIIRMARLWLECTLRETDKLGQAEIGFAWKQNPQSAWNAIIESGLGEIVVEKKRGKERQLLRIKGCGGRTDWLAAKRKAGKLGGKKSRRKVEAETVSAYPESEANPKQESNTPAPVPAPAQLATEVEEPPIPAGKKGDQKRFTNHFQHHFLSANNNSKPTWKKHDFVQATNLLEKHGLNECMQRTTNMFENPPKWIKPPLTFGTLVTNFDHFVVAKATPQLRYPPAKKVGL